MLARAQQGLGHLQPVARVLDGVDGGAGGDAAKHRQLADVVGDRRRGGPGIFDHLGLEGRAAARSRRRLLG